MPELIFCAHQCITMWWNGVESADPQNLGIFRQKLAEYRHIFARMKSETAENGSGSPKGQFSGRINEKFLFGISQSFETDTLVHEGIKG